MAVLVRTSRRASRLARLVSALIALWLSGACLPYTVGSTAQPVPTGEFRRTASMYVIPNAIDLFGDTATAALRGIDVEGRWGLAEGIDVGVRVPSASGAVITLKRRLRGGLDPEDGAVAVMPGVGLVNLGHHAHFELSVLASGRKRGALTPYGGLRIMQVAPMSRGAAHDAPTAGGFLGLRIGDDLMGVSPEIGVFHDPSTLGLRRSRVIYVPAITVHGDALAEVFRRQPRLRRTSRPAVARSAAPAR